MTRVRLNSFGQDKILGHWDARLTRRSQANGRSSLQSDFLPTIANIGETPEAPVATGLAPETRVMTPNGSTQIDALAIGDQVSTSAGFATIQHILKVPTTKTAICIRAPYYGLDQDLIVGMEHRIAVTSDLVDYLFGVETALVPVWALRDGLRAFTWHLPPGCNLRQLQLDRPAALQIGRCAISSLPKAHHPIGYSLSDDEARCFAAEHQSGYHN